MTSVNPLYEQLIQKKPFATRINLNGILYNLIFDTSGKSSDHEALTITVRAFGQKVKMRQTAGHCEILDQTFTIPKFIETASPSFTYYLQMKTPDQLDEQHIMLNFDAKGIASNEFMPLSAVDEAQIVSHVTTLMSTLRNMSKPIVLEEEIWLGYDRDRSSTRVIADMPHHSNADKSTRVLKSIFKSDAKVKFVQNRRDTMIKTESPKDADANKDYAANTPSEPAKQGSEALVALFEKHQQDAEGVVIDEERTHEQFYHLQGVVVNSDVLESFRTDSDDESEPNAAMNKNLSAYELIEKYQKDFPGLILSNNSIDGEMIQIPLSLPRNTQVDFSQRRAVISAQHWTLLSQPKSKDKVSYVTFEFNFDDHGVRTFTLDLDKNEAITAVHPGRISQVDGQTLRALAQKAISPIKALLKRKLAQEQPAPTESQSTLKPPPISKLRTRSLDLSVQIDDYIPQGIQPGDNMRKRFVMTMSSLDIDDEEGDNFDALLNKNNDLLHQLHLSAARDAANSNASSTNNNADSKFDERSKDKTYYSGY